MVEKKNSKQPGDNHANYYGIGEPTPQMLRFKGEMVEEGKADLEPSLEFMRQNPMKTPPNNLTGKNKTPNEKD
ncbi:MAG: hypothetical protein ACOY4Q_13005 [Bacillota bacterium]